MKQVTILGATGSVGQSTLDIIARHRDRFALYALTANDNELAGVHHRRIEYPGTKHITDSDEEDEPATVSASEPA